jgi:hypothetical protein
MWRIFSNSPLLLAVEQLAFVAEDGYGGYTLFQAGPLVLAGDVLVLVHVADVDVHEDEVLLQDGQVPQDCGSRGRGPGSRRTSCRRSRAGRACGIGRRS